MLFRHVEGGARECASVTSLPCVPQGHINVVSTLLDAGAYPNFMEANGNKSTPLDYALVNNHVEVARLLSQRGGLGILDIRELAASCIQRQYRAYHQRSAGSKPKRAPRAKMATVVNKAAPPAARPAHAPTTKEATERAAMRIQAGFKGYRARKEFKAMKRDIDRRHGAAVRIQAAWRVSFGEKVVRAVCVCVCERETICGTFYRTTGGTVDSLSSPSHHWARTQMFR